MIKRLALLCAFLPMLAFGQTTSILGNKVQSAGGVLLSSGQWCFGATCFSVTAGAIAPASSVTPATAAITITNGSGTTYLTEPGIAISGTSFSWDRFVQPAAVSATGLGKPYIACQVGAQYTQNDASAPANAWQCYNVAGQAAWCLVNGGGCTVSPVVSGVSSVFGRAGAIMPAAGDYTAAQITHAADLTASNTFADNQTIPYVVTALDVTNAAFAGGAKCDGTTDDTAAFAAALAAARTVGAAVVVPKGKTCRITSTLSMSGTESIIGQQSTLYFDPPTALSEAIAISSSTGIELTGFALTANTAGPGVSIAIGVDGTGVPTAHTNVHIHDISISGFQGCAAGDNKAAILLAGVTDVEIDHIHTSNNGCPSAGANPGGFEVEATSSPSYRLNIHDSTFLGYATNFGIGLFNVDDSTIHNNYVDEGNTPNSGTLPTSGGYGIMTYGTVLCGGTIAASPGGLSRVSNVVTVTPVSTCGSVNVGDWFVLVGSTSGGTGFDGDYVITAATSSTLTATLVVPVALANDTGGGGAINYSLRGNKIQNNTVLNTSGMGVYIQSTSDAIVSGNVIRNSCGYFNDVSLPCGNISVNQGSRPTISGNNVSGSLLDGIVLSTTWDAIVAPNTVSNTTNAGIRLRTNEQRPTIGHNAVNGAAYGVESDGIVNYANIDANEITNFLTAGIGLQNSSSGFLTVQGNVITGNAKSGVPAIRVTVGSTDYFVGNHISSLLNGSGFDIRTSFNIFANNTFQHLSGGAAYSFTSSSTDNHVFGGIINTATGTGITDAGIRNTWQGIQMLFVTTPVLETGTGSYFAGNHYQGGSSGGPVQTSCPLVAGTCTMTTKEVLATDGPLIQCGGAAGTSNVGALSIGSITAGTSYVVNSSNASDTRTVTCTINH